MVHKWTIHLALRLQWVQLVDYLGGTGCVEIAASKGVGEGAKKKDGFNWFAAASRRVCESGPGTVDPVSPGPRGQQMEG